MEQIRDGLVAITFAAFFVTVGLVSKAHPRAKGSRLEPWRVSFLISIALMTLLLITTVLILTGATAS